MVLFFTNENKHENENNLLFLFVFIYLFESYLYATLQNVITICERLTLTDKFPFVEGGVFLNR